MPRPMPKLIPRPIPSQQSMPRKGMQSCKRVVFSALSVAFAPTMSDHCHNVYVCASAFIAVELIAMAFFALALIALIGFDFSGIDCSGIDSGGICNLMKRASDGQTHIQAKCIEIYIYMIH